MKFKIEEEIFNRIPDLMVGVVVAKGIDNRNINPQIQTLLDEEVASAKVKFENIKVKEAEEILPYREAFQALEMNPNKFQCSVEAMFSRIAKGKDLPHINPLVDLNNAISLKHVIPMGTHDLGCSPEDIEMRYAVDGDTFLPFGANEEEAVPPGEVVYAVGHQVRTRRWTWRQSEYGKITGETSYVFFPIDGFIGFNQAVVEQVVLELSVTLSKLFQCEVKTGFVDKQNRELDLSFS